MKAKVSSDLFNRLTDLKKLNKNDRKKKITDRQICEIIALKLGSHWARKFFSLSGRDNKRLDTHLYIFCSQFILSQIYFSRI